MIVAISGCTRLPAGSAPPATEAPAPAAVTVIKPERTTLRLTVRQPGFIQAFEQTPVFAKIAGYVQKWHVDLGDRVRKGDLLAELSVPEMEVELKQKEALVQQSEAEITQAKETVTAAAASLRSAEARVKEAESGRARARAEYRRMKSQYERLARVGQDGVIDKEAVEETRYGFVAAEAGLEEVEAKVQSAIASREESAARLSKARADVRVAEAHLQVAKENRDQVKALLQYTKLTAPFDGVVTRRTVDTGHFVQPAMGARTEPLFVVERRDFVRIFVEVPEMDAGWINQGDKGRVHVQALRGQEFAGEVARTSYSLDRTARTLVAEIDLPNPTDQLRPGMYVATTITAEHPGILALPASAIVTQGDVLQGYQSYCFLVAEGKAVRTLVQAGRSDGQFIEVLKRQKPGSTLTWVDFTGKEAVAAKAAGLSDGQAVQLSPAAK